eukprot:CAMPEP_0115511448 /NCGR_PEP_ID=MMETSP0271-20121206/73975_1 /TAXON_ID=71861 /ORGANISM="Scrippsiella trochoidea, Strain CCMP3099" /LENGTH=140 /DNA_ID=CAMNT_0002941527 /DNA_START=263 /DNA_END=681 /DNA_ORIENTATION=-
MLASARNTNIGVVRGAVDRFHPLCHRHSRRHREHRNVWRKPPCVARLVEQLARDHAPLERNAPTVEAPLGDAGEAIEVVVHATAPELEEARPCAQQLPTGQPRRHCPLHVEAPRLDKLGGIARPPEVVADIRAIIEVHGV